MFGGDTRQPERGAKRQRAVGAFAALVLSASAVLWYGATSARAQDTGQTIQDCPSCPEMVVVPPGSFVMGSPATERLRNSDEGPRRRVTIAQGFAIGKFEVTRDEIAAFVNETGYAMAQRCSAFAVGTSWRDPGFSQSGRDPVSCIRWADAQAYVRWLSRKTGQIYRLPSEAEWEYAARAGTVTARYWGEAIGRGLANCERCGSKWDHRRTAPVGSFSPNAYGLHDVLGNNWEWVADCYLSSYVGAPVDGRPRIDGGCRYRVMRGGSWESNPSRLRAANRRKHALDDVDNDFGFRVVRELDSESVGPPAGPIVDDELPWLKPPVETVPQDIAILQIIGPSVTVNRTPASNGMQIKNGDYIATGAGSRAKLAFFRGGYLQMEENTGPKFRPRLVGTGKCIIEYALDRGTISGETGNCEVKVTTPAGTGIHSGSKYVLTAGPASTVLAILEGQATIRGGPNAIDVRIWGAEQVVMSPGAISSPRRLNESELRRLEDYLESYRFGAGSSPPAPLSVPPLGGLGIDEAARILSSLGLVLEQMGERSTNRFPPGGIVEQSPMAGATVARGTVVQVFVASGPVLVSVPNLVGLLYDDAARILSQRGLGLMRVGDRRTDQFKPGTIVEQWQNAGTGVPRDTAVQVVIASGPSLVSVPNVVGLHYDDAARILSQRGLGLTRVGERRTNKFEPGTVVEQRQRAGSSLPRDSALQVIVESGAVPTSVPNVVGLTYENAKRVLSRSGLGLKQAGAISTRRVPLNTIAEQRPRGGSSVPPETVIEVYIERAPIQ